jgi:hypothetical protein
MNDVGLRQATVVAKTILAYILSEYSVTTTQRAEDIKRSYELVGVPHPKLKLKFVPRFI